MNRAKNICNRILRVFLWEEKFCKSLVQVIKTNKEKFYPNIQYDQREVFLLLPLKPCIYISCYSNTTIENNTEQNL